MAERIPVQAVQVNGFTMEYCRFGSGEKNLVVLPGLSIQSVLASASAVAQAYRIFTEDYTVWMFDRRKELTRPYTAAEAARDTALALRAAGIDRAVLYGVSYGGMTAMEIAVREPDLVEKLILASACADVGEDQFRIFENWLRLAEAGDAGGLYLAFAELLYPRETYEKLRGLLSAMAESVTEEELEKFRILAEGIRGFSATEALGRIHCPVLALGDKQDRVFGASVEETARRMSGKPGFDSYLYDGYGHAVYDTAPDFRERALRWLK